MISPVSFKRKLRDLVDSKDGEVWKGLAQDRNPEEYDILEKREHGRADITKLLNGDFEKFKRRFWDARVFGNTFLEEGGGDTIRTGVAIFALGVSVAPVRIERQTITKKAPAQEGRTRGMAPLGYRVVEHAVYWMPFHINPTAAPKTGCRRDDVELMLALIPHAYPHTSSTIRPFVEVRHAWYVEHTNPIGSFSEFRFIEEMIPSKKQESEKPSDSWSEYDVPRELPEDLKGKTSNFCDLCETLPDWARKD